jgi:hypothetical protein
LPFKANLPNVHVVIHDPVLGLVFIKTTKVAGSSFEVAIAPLLSDQAIITLNERWVTDRVAAKTIQLRNTHWLPPKRLAAQVLRHRHQAVSIPTDILRGRGSRHECFSFEKDHMTAQQIRDQIGQAEWDRCLKVAIIRNPYERLVSDYFMKRGRSPSPENFPQLNEWLRCNPERILRNERILRLNESGSHRPPQRQIDLDFVIKYEHFDTSLMQFSKRLGIDGNALCERFRETRVHSEFKSNQAITSKRFTLDSESKSLIDSLLSWKFEMFGYDQVTPTKEIA